MKFESLSSTITLSVVSKGDVRLEKQGKRPLFREWVGVVEEERLNVRGGGVLAFLTCQVRG